MFLDAIIKRGFVAGRLQLLPVDAEVLGFLFAIIRTNNLANGQELLREFFLCLVFQCPNGPRVFQKFGQQLPLVEPPKIVIIFVQVFAHGMVLARRFVLRENHH